MQIFNPPLNVISRLLLSKSAGPKVIIISGSHSNTIRWTLIHKVWQKSVECIHITRTGTCCGTFWTQLSYFIFHKSWEFSGSLEHTLVPPVVRSIQIVLHMCGQLGNTFVWNMTPRRWLIGSLYFEWMWCFRNSRNRLSIEALLPKERGS